MKSIVNLFEYERLAKARMTPMAFDYYASGAMDEITVRANRRAFDEILLRYRVLAGATAAVWPLRFKASATKPLAFISSMNASR